MKKVTLLAALVIIVTLYALVARIPARVTDGQTVTTPPSGLGLALMSAPLHHSATQAATSTLALCVISTGVTQGLVNLRACGSLACGVIGALSEGETLTVLAPSSTWSHVQTGAGLTGYVNSNFCH